MLLARRMYHETVTLTLPTGEEIVLVPLPPREKDADVCLGIKAPPTVRVSKRIPRAQNQAIQQARMVREASQALQKK